MAGPKEADVTRVEDALAQALGTMGWFDTGYTEATDLQNATAIIAALPPDVAICSVAEVAERLTWALLRGQDARLVEARRLLGLDAP